MLCPRCHQNIHVSHLGVTVCLHCKHIGQVAHKPLQVAKVAQKSRLATMWQRFKLLPYPITTICLIVIAIGSSGLALQRHIATSARQTPVVAVKQPSKTASQKPAATAPASAIDNQPVTNQPAPAARPKQVTTPAAITPNPITINGICQVDASQAMDQYNRSVEMARVCNTVIPQIVARLSASPCSPPYRIVLDVNQYAAYTSACVVHVSITWLRNSPYDPGAIPHELTHAIQGYGSIAPSWITEGIATYMSYKLGYSIGIAHCNSNESYLSGYGCGASLFNYIERVYRPSIVKDVHSSIKNYTYSDGLFQTETGGRTLNQLYAECLQAECKGGQTL